MRDPALERVPPLGPSGPTRDPRRAYLSLGVAGALLLWLFLLYSRSLYQLTPTAGRPLWRFLGPLALAPDFLNPVFRSPLAFVASYVLGLGLVAWAVARLARRIVGRLLLTLCAALALAFPLLLPHVYGEYRMPVAAADGYELRWITEPGNRYSSAFRRAQLAHEAQGSFHLLGWSSDGILYIRGGLPGVRSYDPGTGESRWLLTLLGRAGVNGAAVERAGGGVYLPQPASLTAPGYPFLTLERAPSPDGEWEAIAVRWYSGPSDVVLVRTAG